MTMPASDVDRLRRVFELELSRGCDNQAVIGGIDRFIIQLGEAGTLGSVAPLLRRARALPVHGYRSLTAEQREAWIRDTVEALTPKRTASKTPARAGRQTTATRERLEATPAVRRPAGPTGPLDLTDEVTKLPGVGPAGAQRFEKLGVRSAADAAALFPRRYNDFSDVRRIEDVRPSNATVTVVGKVLSVGQTGFGRRMRGSEALLSDGSGTLRAVWFNMPYVAKALAGEDAIVVSGRVRLYRGRLQMENPEFEPFDPDLMHPGRLVPVYPGTAGLSQRTIRRAVKAAVDALADRLNDPIPAWVSKEAKLPGYAVAVRALHYPASLGEAEEARRRIALGEFLAIQCAVLMRRAAWQRESNAPRFSLGDAEAALRSALPFALTKAQDRVLREVLADVGRPQPMLRLLQGDVGSGKTVVAFVAIVAAVLGGYQGALMAPTEILADQHFRSFARLLGGGETEALAGIYAPPWLPKPVRMVLITGSLTATQREQARRDAAHGGADIVIGTHALLEDDVILPSLGLAVVDEQHRFGVMQRLKLRRKGLNPHLLVMTATPIPRTLALTVYGDLESSTIDELPPGRRPVKTDWVQPHERDEAYGFVRERLDAGEQAFVICPLVEDSEALDVRSAEEEFQRLQHGPFRNYRLGLLHGRMTPKQKDEIMAKFASGETQMLVSTSVIEVGIDIPNATVIVIEGAERFGLSQLHQFRGRVGRSAKQSYCLLFSTNEDPGPDARDRLNAMVDTSDGFRLAEVDLELRGEGEAWGTAQSGVNSMLHVARLTDRDLLAEAREMAARVLAADPGLQRIEHRSLAIAAAPLLGKATEAN